MRGQKSMEIVSLNFTSKNRFMKNIKKLNSYLLPESIDFNLIFLYKKKSNELTLIDKIYVS